MPEFRKDRPISWELFLKLPRHMQVAYVKTLREIFNVPDLHLAKMFGVSNATLTARFQSLKCNNTKIGLNPKWDKAGFCKWCEGAKIYKDRFKAAERLYNEAKLNTSIDIKPGQKVRFNPFEAIAGYAIEDTLEDNENSTGVVIYVNKAHSFFVVESEVHGCKLHTSYKFSSIGKEVWICG